MASSFPASSKISPSVRVAEADFSAYERNVGINKTALVGFARKGPINVPTTVSSVEELFLRFAKPDPTFDSHLIYAAIDTLREAGEATILRVGQDDEGSADFARRAFVDIPSGGIHAQLVTGVTEATWGGIGNSLDDDHYIRIRANGSQFIRELTIPKDVTFTALTNAAGVSTTSLESILLAQIKPEDGFTITHCGTGTSARLIFKSTVNGASSSIEIVSSRYNLYNSDDTGATTPSNTIATEAGTGSDLTLGIGLEMGIAQKTGTALAFNSSTSGTWNFGGYKNLRLEIMVWGSGDPLIDGQIQAVYLPADSDGDNLNGVTTDELIDWLNGIASGSPNIDNKGFFFVNSSGYVRVIAGTAPTIAASPSTPEAWYFTGSEGKVLVRSSSTAGTMLGLTNVVAAGTDPDVYTDTESTVICTPASTKLDASKVIGSETTTSYPTFRVWASTPGSDGNDTYVQVSVDAETARINLNVIRDGIVVESLNGLHKNEDATDNTKYYYIERYINGFSDFISVEDDLTVEDLPKPGTYRLGSTDLSQPQAGTDGVPADPDDQATLIIGNPLLGTGLYALAEPEKIDIDLVAVPGVSTTSVVNALKNLCENIRLDCMFVLDPPFGMTPTNVRKWHQGQHPLNSTKFDTSYGAMYWPWLEVYDPYNQVDVWTPPSGSVLAVYARTDSVAFPWFAPAGLNRGMMSWVKRTEYVAYLGERDALYADDNCVNVITFLPNEGAVVFGQKTLQRFASALDRVNVRRMFLYVEKTIKRLSRRLLFDPHDQATIDNLENLISTVVGNVVTNRGAYDYLVEFETVNNAETRNRNELRCRVGIQPIKDVEFIFIQFTANREGTFELSSLGPTPVRAR